MVHGHGPTGQTLQIFHVNDFTATQESGHQLLVLLFLDTGLELHKCETLEVLEYLTTDVRTGVIALDGLLHLKYHYGIICNTTSIQRCHNRREFSI
jgi:hypothetical protein